MLSIAKSSFSLEDFYKKIGEKDMVFVDIPSHLSNFALEAGALIELPALNFLFGSGISKKIYIRESLLGVWNMIDSNRQKPALLQGSPGVGKTTLTWLWCLRESFRQPVFYVSFIGEECRFFYLKDAKIYAMRAVFHNLSDCVIFAKQLARICSTKMLVIDGVKDDNFFSFVQSLFVRFLHNQGNVIFLSSIRVRFTKAQETYPSFRVKNFFLKSWTLDEYICAFTAGNEILWNEMRDLFDDLVSKEEAIKRKYFFVGGCARWMFGYNVRESRDQVNAELARISDLKLVLSGLQGIAAMDTPNHVFQILEIISETELEEPQYSIVSRYAIQKLSQKLGAELFEISKKVAPNNMGYIGIIFEEEFKYYVRKNNFFEVIAFEELTQNKILYRRSKREERFKFEFQFEFEFFSEKEIFAKHNLISPPTLFLPTNLNQPYLDAAVLVDERFLVVIQNTVGKQHSNDLQNLRPFIDALQKKIEKVYIFYVVENFNFSFSAPVSNLININSTCKVSPEVKFFVGKPLYK
jgi:hypothetical protein